MKRKERERCVPTHFMSGKGKKIVISFMVVCAVLLIAAGIMKAGSIADTGDSNSGEETHWYDDNRLIAHALGKIDGSIYTNSREALESNYAQGFRVFECDFLLTADDELVACHDWDNWKEMSSVEIEGEIPTREEFLSDNVYYSYTAMSVDDVLLYMKEHTDVWIVTDTKYLDYEEYSIEFQAMVDAAVGLGCEDVLSRMIVQIYNEEMFADVQAIYPFSNWIFTLYMTGFAGDTDQFEEFANFCKDNGIDVITMWDSLYNDEIGEIAVLYGVEIFVHTVDDPEEKEIFLNKNVGVYTNVW